MGNKNSIKRTHPADAANIYVRNLLCEISERLGGFSKDDLKKTLKFFDHKCPYTGQTITKKNYALDHIEPHNRACCGLHIYGNVIPCYKKANARKSDKGFEDFINSIEEITEEEKQSRIKKLKDFISESNYHNIKESIGNELKDLIEIEYQEIKSRGLSLAEQICKDNLNLEKVKCALNDIVNRRKKESIKKWNSDPKLKCHKIIALYLQELKNYGKVTRDGFISLVEKSSISTNPKGAIASLMTDSGNSYGKVFMENEGNVVISPEIEDCILDYEWKL